MLNFYKFFRTDLQSLNNANDARISQLGAIYKKKTKQIQDALNEVQNRFSAGNITLNIVRKLMQENV